MKYSCESPSTHCIEKIDRLALGRTYEDLSPIHLS